MSEKSLNRRNFFKNSIAGSAALGAAAGIGAGRAEGATVNPESPEFERVETFLEDKTHMGKFAYKKGMKRPHIFLISADMISPDTYHPARELAKHVKLPNIHSIGSEGTRFDNAVCTIPLCGPSRASIFTGKYPPYLTNGERAPHGMKVDLHKEDIIFQEYLRKSGYTTKHVGKCHVGTLKFMDAFGENDAAWDRWSPPVMEDDAYVAFLKEKGVEAPVYKRELKGKQYDRKTPGNSYGGWIKQKNGKDFPLDAQYSVYLAELAVNKLDAALNVRPGDPVYLQLDFFDPHQPYSIPAGLEQRAAELRKHIKLPESYQRVVNNDFQPLKNEAAVIKPYRQYWGAYDPELVREYILGHCLQMEIVDHALGILFDEIKRRGIWDDSVIIFTGDHGEINGRLALFDKGVYFHPDIFRVPFNVKLAKDSGAEPQVIPEPVSTLDIAQTILSQAGVEVDEGLDGEDLTPVLTGTGGRPELQQLFQTGWHLGVNYGVGFQIYDDEQHHWFYGYNICDGSEDLFNMAEPDPVNLIGDRRYDAVHQRIVTKLAGIISQEKRWLGYWAAFRLHNADMLPISTDDMQMFVPSK